MSCNFSHLYRHVKDEPCGAALAMPGTGDTIYVFDIDACFPDGAPSPQDATKDSNTEGFYDAATFKKGLQKGSVIAIDIKADSGQVTSEKNEDNEGRSLVGTAIVDHSIDDFSAIDEAMAFSNIGVLFPDNAGDFYVIMSPFKRTQYTCNYDSGTTYDSDHGFTITFTCSPVLYACPKVRLTATELSSFKYTTPNT